MILAKFLALPALSVCVCTAAHASTMFNFDNDNLGTSTTFTDTFNGLSATFSSSADPGGFVIYPSFFETLTGNVLGDPGPAGANGLALDIAFSQPLTAIVLDFATADFGTPSPLTLMAYENSALVGSVTEAGMFLPGYLFPEGEIAFGGPAFDSVVISSTAPDFAVDNIDVVQGSAVPEPSTWSLLALGLCLLCLCSMRRRLATFAAVPVACAALLSVAMPASAQSTQSILPLLPPSVSTVPSNGDVNPYGVAFVPSTVPKGGTLQPGDILVTNFNNIENLQGTGTTIVRVDKAGNTSTFFAGRAYGPSAAIGVLSDGLVFVGNLPTADGTAATAQPGTLFVLDRFGDYLGTLGTKAVVDGPWGMAIKDTGNGVTGTAHIFLSNVLSGTVSRFDVAYNATQLGASAFVLADGFNHRADPAALELGPAGLAYSASNDTLYVTSSADNAIYEIPAATAAHSSPVAPKLLVQDDTHMHGPLDIAILPDGNLLVANSDGSNVDPNQPSELVEYTPAGQFMNQMPVDPNNGGAFGLAVNNLGWGTFRLAAVDDNTNRLNIWTSVIP